MHTGLVSRYKVQGKWVADVGFGGKIKMLTPKFSVRQDDGYIVLEIKVPFGKLKEGEIHIEENSFIFYAKPYYLRLHFSGKLLENGSESLKYESEKGLCEIRIPKANPGEIFSDLDMLTKLLTPQKGPKPPSIEVLGETSCEGPGDEWLWDQTVCVDEDDEEASSRHYGFANKYHGIFKRLQEEIPEAVDVRDPELKGRAEQTLERLAHEKTHFSDDHYLADKYENEMIAERLKYESPWKKWKHVNFTDEESQQLINLPKREYLLDENAKRILMLGLVDILFSFAYDVRTTFGEATVETSWTVCKLSATLSWLHCFQSLREVAVSSARRSLCYPCYRHWDLSMTVLKDTVDLLNSGRVSVVKALLAVHTHLSSSEYYYIINDIYILDYLIWTQYLSSKELKSLATALQKISVKKEDVDLDLLALEAAADTVIEEEKMKGLGEGVQSLAIDPRSALDSDDDES